MVNARKDEESTLEVPTQKSNRQGSQPENLTPWEPENNRRKQTENHVKMRDVKGNNKTKTSSQDNRAREHNEYRTKLTNEEAQAHNGHQKHGHHHDNTEDQPAHKDNEKYELQNGFKNRAHNKNKQQELTTYSQEYTETNNDNWDHHEHEKPAKSAKNETKTRKWLLAKEKKRNESESELDNRTNNKNKPKGLTRHSQEYRGTTHCNWDHHEQRYPARK